MSGVPCECGCGERVNAGRRYVFGHGLRGPRGHDVDPVTGCWNYQGTLDQAGYGSMRWGGKTNARAHRVYYERIVGPIPEGLTLDHLCSNRRCVNPAHLEPVTQAVNVMRGNTITARNAAKTHCIRGHAFDEENTYVRPDNGCRQCRACTRVRKERAA